MPQIGAYGAGFPVPESNFVSAGFLCVMRGGKAFDFHIPGSDTEFDFLVV